MSRLCSRANIVNRDLHSINALRVLRSWWYNISLSVLGCVEEEPEYRLDDIECALRYNSLDSGIPTEYDEDDVANSINTTLNRYETA